MRNCEGCPFTQLIPKYQTTLHVPLTTFLDVVSIDVSGPFIETAAGNKQLLIGVEQLTEWPFAKARRSGTADVLLDFMEKEIVYPFPVPSIVFSDSACASR